MRELTKSIVRRMHDPAFHRYFSGIGIDIGGGPDPLGQYVHLFPTMIICDTWDKNHGDAQYMQGMSDDRYQFVHSSHTLEHMDNPAIAIVNWIRILRPGGHLICVVPDETMYEHLQWPSVYNGDHKYSFRIAGSSTMPKSIKLVEFLDALTLRIDVLSIKLLHETFNAHIGGDQTLGPIAECAIEFVLLKR